MILNALADIVLIIHLAFVLFVALGGLLVIRWRGLAWFHAPAFLWGGCIEIVGWICPLTPLETLLRERGGAAGYQTSFLEHYLVPVLYPPGLTRSVQVTLGLLVLAFNAGLYWLAFRTPSSRRPEEAAPASRELGRRSLEPDPQDDRRLGGTPR